MSNTSFRNFNFRSDGLRSEFSTNKLKYNSYLSTSAVKRFLHTEDVIQVGFGIFNYSLMFALDLPGFIASLLSLTMLQFIWKLHFLLQLEHLTFLIGEWTEEFLETPVRSSWFYRPDQNKDHLEDYRVNSSPSSNPFDT